MARCGFAARVLAALAILAPCLAGCGPSEPDLPQTHVVINSSPEQGAEVTILGEVRGATPVEVKGLPVGWQDVLLRKERYNNTVDRIDVKEGGRQEFTLELDPLVGYLTLQSTPEGAEVYLADGELLGKTPFFRQPLPVGEHTYELRYPNHYPHKDTITVESDYQYEHTYNLKPVEGNIQLTSRPSGARVWINNEPQEKKTPFSFTLAPGTYVVSVYSPGYVQAEEKVELLPAETKELSIKMLPGDVPAGMVLVPEGEFIMGADNRAPDEAPVRKIVQPAFYIDKQEVTNEEYAKVFPNHKFPEGQEQLPVQGVSWNEAVRYAESVGKRLPTEAEWEKAARGEAGLEYPWGVDFNSDLCNSQESNIDGPVRVGKYLGGASPYGCMDMAGNVYEWTQNWYEAYPGNADVTKDYGQVYRILRGGSYRTPKFDVRCAKRFFDKMDAKKPDYGFRCAKDVAAAQ